MEYLEKLEENFKKLIGGLREELSNIRTNRPTPKLIEDIMVNYMEGEVPIKQLGSIAVEIPRNLIITPWDKESVQSIAKGIDNEKLGITVSAQGHIVRVTLPELTDERREELGKIVKKIAEDIRIRMRISRDEVNKKINAETDKDIKFKNKEKLQKSVDAFNKEVDNLVEMKLKEISQ